jgi:hypothetical protein
MGQTVSPVTPAGRQDEPDIRGLEKVTIKSIMQCPSTIPSDDHHTRIRIHGFGKSLWSRKNLDQFAVGSVVSVMIQTVVVYDVEQCWLLFIDNTDLSTLVSRANCSSLTRYSW